MSFGRLVLKGVQRKAAPPRKRLRRKRGRGPLPASVIPLQSSEENLPVPVEPAPPEVQRPEIPEETAPVRRTFTLTDIIRPPERVKASMEGFFLDQRSEHTRRAYSKDLKRFVQFLLARRAAFGNVILDRTVVIAYKDYLLADGLEATTVDRHQASLRSLFKWFVDDGLIEKSPVEGVRFLKPRRQSRTRGFTDEEVRRVLEIPDLHTKTGALHYAVLMMLFYCGLRRSELVGIRTGQIFEERGHRVLRLRGKGDSERLIVLMEPVWNAIRYYFLIARRSLSEDQWLFLSPRKKQQARMRPMDSSSVFYIVKRYAKVAGINAKVSPHSCRATAISNARDHNVSDRAIQEFAGWASTEMITRYDKRKTLVEQSASKAIRYEESGAGNDLGRIPKWVRNPSEDAAESGD